MHEDTLWNQWDTSRRTESSALSWFGQSPHSHLSEQHRRETVNSMPENEMTLQRNLETRPLTFHTMYLPWRGSHFTICEPGSKHCWVMSATYREHLLRGFHYPFQIVCVQHKLYWVSTLSARTNWNGFSNLRTECHHYCMWSNVFRDCPRHSVIPTERWLELVWQWKEFFRITRSISFSLIEFGRKSTWIKSNGWISSL